jgi:hypothetical protein
MKNRSGIIKIVAAWDHDPQIDEKYQYDGSYLPYICASLPPFQERHANAQYEHKPDWYNWIYSHNSLL